MRLLTPALLSAGLVLFLTALPARSSAAVDEELEELMYSLKRHLKGAAQALQDPSMEAEALDHIAQLQAAAHAAKVLEPSNLDEIPEGERAQHVRSYRRDMAEVLGVLVDMEIDVLEGRREEAAGKLADPLYKLREAAHEKYQD